MIRASIHIVKDGVITGYLTDLAVLPRIGESILLLDGDGGEVRGRVWNVKHILFTLPDARAGSQQVEVMVNGY